MSRLHRRWMMTAMTSAAAALSLTSHASALSDQPEVEPNEGKAWATVVQLAAGDSISGVTTGASSTAGLASVDYFRIRSVASVPGVYRHRVVVSSATPGHTVTIRGLPQFNGVIGATDVAVQTGAAGTVPSRAVQWYGFGKQEEIYFRVAGTVATTSPYSAVMATDSVPLLTLSGNLSAGPITVSTVNSNGVSGLDTDIWLYDGAMNAMPDGGNDDAFGGSDSTSSFTRPLAAGTYTVAVGRFNVANELPSPADDRWRNGPVLDFPDALLSSAVAPASAVSFELRISDGVHPALVQPLILPLGGIGDIAFVRFSVQSASTAVGVGSASPDPVALGQSTQLSVQVTAAPGSNLNNITAVTANISALTGVAGDTAVAMARAGTSDQWVLPVVVNSSVGPGVKLVGFAITDSGATLNPAVGSFPISVVQPPPPNDGCSSPANLTLDVPYLGDTATATSAGDEPAGTCAPTSLFGAVWHSFTPATSGSYLIETCGSVFDTVLVAFEGGCSQLTQLACNDDANCVDSGLTSRISSLPLAAGQTCLLRVSGFNAPAIGQYQIVVHQLPPQGACCVGSCCTLVVQSSCSGTWTTGVCEPSPCTPPSNQACAAPLPLLLSTPVAGDNCNAAVASQGPAGSGSECTQPGGKPVWFSFVPPATAAYTFSACGSWFDTILTVFQVGDCGDSQSYVQIACNDDAQPACQTGSSLGSVIGGIVLAGGATYTVRLEGFGLTNPASGIYQLEVTAAASFGACCQDSACTLTDASNCPGDFTLGATCLPESCLPVTGACCWGVTCAISTASGCASPIATYTGDGTACNPPGNTSSPCCIADFNHAAGLSVQDIFDFLGAYFAGSPAADINGSGLSVQDIFDFLAAYFTGC